MLAGLAAHGHLLLVNSVSLAALLNSLDQGTLLAPWCYRQVEDSQGSFESIACPQQLSLMSFR